MKLTILALFANLLLNASDTTKMLKPLPPLPMELLMGSQKIYYQILIKRNISKDGKPGLINLTSYSTDYKKDIPMKEFMTTTVIYYSLAKGVSINAGAIFNGVEGLNPFI